MNLISWKPDNTLVQTLTQIRDLKISEQYQSTDKISCLANSLSPLVETVEANPPLRKAFVRWLGKKDLIASNGKLDSKKIAQHLFPIEDWEQNFKALIEKMLHVTKKFISQKFNNSIPRHFKDLAIEKLDQKMWKSYHGILSILALISKLEKIKPENNEKALNIEKIILSLRTYCLHYLVMVSKSPIFDTDVVQHCPFPEYISDNAPRYHREDGGQIGLIFLSEMIKKHPWLENYSPVVIKNQTYFNLIRQFCHTFFLDNNRLTYFKATDLDEIEDSVRNSNSPFVFLDISSLIDANNDSKQDPLKEVVEKCLEKFAYTGKILFLGALLNFYNQDCCFFYSQNMALLEHLKNSFVDFQGNHGAFPEIMRFKTYLLNSGFDPNSFLDLYPLEQRKCVEQYLTIESIYTPKFTETDVHLAHLDLIQCLETFEVCNNNIKNNQFVSFYVRFFLSLIKNLPTSLLITDSGVCEAVVLRFKKIQKLLSQVHKLSFSEQNMNFHLIFQHIQILLIFFRSDSIETLPELFNQMSPLPPAGVKKETFVTTSGITCLGMIYEALKKIFPSNSSSDKPIAVFGHSCYYQLVESDSGLKNCMSEHFTCEVQSFIEHPTISTIEKKRIGILFLDRLPNRVVLPKVTVIEIEKIVKDILEEPRDPNFPLVVVVDCATTLLMHQDIQDLIAKLGDEIKEGKLIMVPTTSLIKWQLGGMDLYSGGTIEVFSSNSNKHAELLERYLKVASGEDALSLEASRTFHLVIKHATPLIQEYHQIITKNTHIVYQKLEEAFLLLKEKPKVKTGEKNDELPSLNPIQVGVRSQEIPMIGLHFNDMYHQIFPNQDLDLGKLNVIVRIMQYVLFTTFIKFPLPVTIKPSFGFQEPNLIECWQALRFTLGLDEKHLQSYVDEILKVNNSLKATLSSPQICKKLSEKIQFLSTVKDLPQKMSQVHAPIMSSGEGFVEILEFFYIKIKSLENYPQTLA